LSEWKSAAVGAAVATKARWASVCDGTPWIAVAIIIAADTTTVNMVWVLMSPRVASNASLERIWSLCEVASLLNVTLVTFLAYETKKLKM
jgi:hypothetical protein